MCNEVRDSEDAIFGDGCTRLPVNLGPVMPVAVPFDSGPDPSPRVALIVRIDVSVSQSQEPAVCKGFPATMVPVEREDEVEGTSAADVIVTFGSDDEIECKGGNNIIYYSGPGNHKVRGNGGHDYIDAGPDEEDLR